MSAPHLDLVRVTELMGRTTGRPEISVGLVDGPVALTHPGFSAAQVRVLTPRADCSRTDCRACRHGTFVAGMLWARRDGTAPAICPGCDFLVRPIFGSDWSPEKPSASVEVLADAITDCVRAGARIVNLSAGLRGPSPNLHRGLRQALDDAARRGTIVVAAAGNEGTLGGSAITRHAAVIPVVATDLAGRPLGLTNLGATAGRRGLAAPGTDMTSLAPGGQATLSGTSVATPLVTGALALLWSEFPGLTAEGLKLAVTGAGRRGSITPPLLDVQAIHAALARGTTS